VRDAAVNLGVLESLPRSPGVSAALSSFSAASGTTGGKLQALPKLPPIELADQPNNFPKVPQDDFFVPKLEPYGPPKSNSSLMKRLSDKFGLPH